MAGILRAPTGTTTTASPTATPSTSGPMSRSDFERVMAKRFSVFQIRTGTFQDQSVVNTRRGVQPNGQLTQANWQAWDPGSSSEVYSSIVTAFESFQRSIGGTPPVTEITFFATDYRVDNGRVVPEPTTGADFGAGTMRVYRAATISDRPLPFARSTSSGQYPGAPVLGVGGIEGQSPGAPLGVPTPRQSTERNITHELGHGLAEQAYLGEPDLWQRYPLSVGWFNRQLFDIAIPDVASALRQGQAPPTTVSVGRRSQPTQITPSDWNHPRWREQPISHYMVAGGPAEDFAEAVMAFIANPGLLRERSPHRYEFVERGRARWQPFLVRPPEMGDFPIDERIRHMA